MPRFFDDAVPVAHKTGAIDGVRHDAGVFWVPEVSTAAHDPMAARGAVRPSGRPIIFVVLSRNLDDRSWSVENAGEAAIGRLARAAVLEEFGAVYATILETVTSLDEEEEDEDEDGEE